MFYGYVEPKENSGSNQADELETPLNKKNLIFFKSETTQKYFLSFFCMLFVKMDH